MRPELDTDLRNSLVSTICTIHDAWSRMHAHMRTTSTAIKSRFLQGPISFEPQALISSCWSLLLQNIFKTSVFFRFSDTCISAHQSFIGVFHHSPFKLISNKYTNSFFPWSLFVFFFVLDFRRPWEIATEVLDTCYMFDRTMTSVKSRHDFFVNATTVFHGKQFAEVENTNSALLFSSLGWDTCTGSNLLGLRACSPGKNKAITQISKLTALRSHVQPVSP